MPDSPRIWVDGNLADWEGIEAIPLRGRENVVRSIRHYCGNVDQSATFRYAWDTHALYVAIEVEDDVILQTKTGVMTWAQDCVQLDSDLDPRLEEATTGNVLADEGTKRRYSEINIAQTTNGVEAFRSFTFNAETHPVGLLKAEEFQLQITTSGNTRIYEAAFPWITLGSRTPPEPSSVVGVAFTINDADDPKQDDPSALGIFKIHLPREFGELFLAE